MIDTSSAFDGMFTAGSGRFVGSDGRMEHLAVRQWAGRTDRADRQLFTDLCAGPTIDLGCGPGRLMGDLVDRGIPALGIDVSAEAVRQTRRRGAQAVMLDVFDDVPGTGGWRHALLADGNIGIGGDPVRLLRRARDLLDVDGTVLVEVSPLGTGLVRDHRRLWVEGRLSPPFAWAVVGLDAIDSVARDAGLLVTDVRTAAGRHAVTLTPA
ncbi:class I SAM-dependent methyltransferase [Aeromicrobium sp. Leaf350]|uniref:class I SAM-dependent methyltransferase n=1 Tax=Aeromicrobium sp. Leaf350 TaxID=2876565 RepID=UPI001E46990E|nr:class I SAM-dependent methyltransferase [Aeromicrobium sp. Leaf350]